MEKTSDSHIINDPIIFTIKSLEVVGERLDKHLCKRFTNYSRRYLQKLIDDNHVTVNGKPAVASYRIKGNDTISVFLPDRPVKLKLEAEDLTLDVVYEDEDLLIIVKPAGMVVHPADRYRHLTGTVVNAVLYHCRNTLSGINGVLRPGIVHRLDKDTSGLLIVAKTDKAHKHMADVIKNHYIRKEYLTLVYGHLKPMHGSIDAPIGRDPVHRHKKMVAGIESQDALTHYSVKQYAEVDGLKASLVRVRIVTGRTHQIRVHLSSIGHPVLGDSVYGDQEANAKVAELAGLKRQFLHAFHLTFRLPNQKKESTFTGKLPNDLQKVMDTLGLTIDENEVDSYLNRS